MIQKEDWKIVLRNHGVKTSCEGDWIRMEIKLLRKRSLRASLKTKSVTEDKKQC
jgi:hypothetical protein